MSIASQVQNELNQQMIPVVRNKMNVFGEVLASQNGSQ